MDGLSVSNVVQVTVNLSPLAAAVRSFGVLLVAGDSDVINGVERLRTYQNVDGVESDFGVDAPETEAAELYFSQVPQPQTMMIGRWLRTATAAENDGAILTLSEQALSIWTGITSGGVDIVINGSAQNLSGLDFSGATSLNGVASIITAALSGGAVCTWNGSFFTITSGTTGAGNNAQGTITLTTNPANNDTITVNGTLVTLVTGTPTGSEVQIGVSSVATALAIQEFLAASSDSGIDQATYTVDGNIITVTFNSVGTGGNSFTLAKSSTHIAVSAGTLAGGTAASSVGYATTGAGTDISSLLGLTAALSQALIPGFNSETPAQCAAVLANLSAVWYGLMFQASVQPTDDQSIDVSAFIEAQDITRIYGVTITNTNVLSSLVTTDLASRMKNAGYKQSFCQYSSMNVAAIASFFGRAFSVDFTANNTTITMMFKQEPGVIGENLTSDQAAILQGKRCNVFVDYVNDTTIIQYGVMSGSAYFDEIQGLDWLQNAIQTALYNVLYLSPTKLPQTDSGVNQLTNAIDGVMGQAVNNGLVAPGVWNAPGFGQLQTGQFLKTGYYIFAESVNLQSQSDRDARKAPPIQVAAKLAGAIQDVNVLVNVNR